MCGTNGGEHYFRKRPLGRPLPGYPSLARQRANSSLDQTYDYGVDGSSKLLLGKYGLIADSLGAAFCSGRQPRSR